MNEPIDDAKPAADAALDLAPIREQLNLAPDAPETDIIAAMLQVIAAMDAKYQELLASSAKAEDEITNRDLADYSDIVTDETAPFWRESIIANRAGTLSALDAIRASTKPAVTEPAAVVPPVAAAPVALRNRVSPAAVKPVSAVITGTDASDTRRAAAIRNRAHEIRARDSVPFLVAFHRAEKEITPAQS
jgi:hypothetical protein